MFNYVYKIQWWYLVSAEIKTFHLILPQNTYNTNLSHTLSSYISLSLDLHRKQSLFRVFLTHLLQKFPDFIGVKISLRIFFCSLQLYTHIFYTILTVLNKCVHYIYTFYRILLMSNQHHCVSILQLLLYQKTFNLFFTMYYA